MFYKENDQADILDLDNNVERAVHVVARVMHEVLLRFMKLLKENSVGEEEISRAVEISIILYITYLLDA